MNVTMRRRRQSPRHSVNSPVAPETVAGSAAAPVRELSPAEKIEAALTRQPAAPSFTPAGAHPFTVPVTDELQRMTADVSRARPYAPGNNRAYEELARTWVPDAWSPDPDAPRNSRLHAGRYIRFVPDVWGPRPAVPVKERMDALTYPPCDVSGHVRGYAQAMRRVSLITGTRSSFEDPAAWPHPGRLAVELPPLSRGLAITAGPAEVNATVVMFALSDNHTARVTYPGKTAGVAS